ncbi:hypothetical protein RNZ50_07790 [Paracoccaceae bacterium Fryx2]|nr:hypothetical protein [Paracoccaceae bacterium Fryx2]
MLAQKSRSEAKIDLRDGEVAQTDLLEILSELQGSCDCSWACWLDWMVNERRSQP